MRNEKNDVLIVDDEAGMRHMLRLVLEKGGYRVTEAKDGREALDYLRHGDYDLILCDIRMPEMDGLEFLREIAARDIGGIVIMMSAYGSVETAIQCLKAGAYDYISKPFKPDEVILALRKAQQKLRLQRENALLRKKLSRGKSNHEIVFQSTAMEHLMAMVSRVAQSFSPVLITGETGTGKELVARALHRQSARGDCPFVAINCGAIASGLIESELFGHSRGAFTGALQQKPGLIEEADGGTLFLDEIGELPLELQPKLLRVLQEGEIRRVGENLPRKVDVRVLAATALDLREAVAKSRFRDDLYFRLAVVEINIPPLRERREDIPVLAKHFIGVIADREGRSAPCLTPLALDVLRRQNWDGNVRELANFIERAMIFSRGDTLEIDGMPLDRRFENRKNGKDFSLKKASVRLEKEYIRKALAVTAGNRTQAARLLEISLRKLLYKIKEYRIES
ncbi:sigma-54-dependent transcriptional regulator [Syntrophotalea acetylenica]|uniref:Histidine kinase n=1 Tax=Syntrophotalea acetylenica TaxID=29542 RepID=A0A1L3GHH2_SYNAC|nr:sigma-54 dependent transcriptional regulator [Syntrophotalea acetylenica]APG25381.1 histidine kinase [Syntrophotalea acetylenica]APG43448.1 histidine kinase [Syntrophotalea acetylenica]